MSAARGLSSLVGLLLAALLVACSDGDAAGPATEPTASVIAAPATTPTPRPAPTATALPTPTPEPTPDPILAQAEAVVLEYDALSTALAADPRDFDLTRMLELEAPSDVVVSDPPPGSFEVDVLVIVAGMLERNIYQDPAKVVTELIGSRYADDQVVVVDLCVQTDGTFRDLDTDEIAMTSLPGPGIVSYRVAIATMQILDLSENLEENSCTMHGDR